VKMLESWSREHAGETVRVDRYGRKLAAAAAETCRGRLTPGSTDRQQSPSGVSTVDASAVVYGVSALVPGDVIVDAAGDRWKVADAVWRQAGRLSHWQVSLTRVRGQG